MHIQDAPSAAGAAPTERGGLAASARGFALLGRVSYREITASDEREELYRMRYRAYLAAGSIAPSADERVFDHYENAPDTWTFGIDVDGELAASIRLHVLSRRSRPGFTPAIYGDVVDPLLEAGRVMVDAARFTVDPQASARHPDLPLLALRLAYVACEHFDADTGVAMVREDHEAFYRRFFLHERVAGPRPFPGWTTRRNVLMLSDFRAGRDAVVARFPIMASSTAERRKLFGVPAGRPAGSETVPVEAAE